MPFHPVHQQGQLTEPGRPGHGQRQLALAQQRAPRPGRRGGVGSGQSPGGPGDLPGGQLAGQVAHAGLGQLPGESRRERADHAVQGARPHPSGRQRLPPADETALEPAQPGEQVRATAAGRLQQGVQPAVGDRAQVVVTGCQQHRKRQVGGAVGNRAFHQVLHHLPQLAGRQGQVLAQVTFRPRDQVRGRPDPRQPPRRLRLRHLGLRAERREDLGVGAGQHAGDPRDLLRSHDAGDADACQLRADPGRVQLPGRLVPQHYAARPQSVPPPDDPQSDELVQLAAQLVAPAGHRVQQAAPAAAAEQAAVGGQPFQRGLVGGPEQPQHPRQVAVARRGGQHLVDQLPLRLPGPPAPRRPHALRPPAPGPPG